MGSVKSNLERKKRRKKKTLKKKICKITSTRNDSIHDLGVGEGWGNIFLSLIQRTEETAWSRLVTVLKPQGEHRLERKRATRGRSTLFARSKYIDSFQMKAKEEQGLVASSQDDL